MILVADCSALIALASCDGLHLLDALFSTVIVPEAVYREAVVGDKPEARQLKEYLQDKVRKIDPVGSVLLDGFSDLGETEAMLLYKQYSADKLLIDDKRGRRVAKINHISPIGSLGVSSCKFSSDKLGWSLPVVGSDGVNATGCGCRTKASLENLQEHII